MNYNVLKWNVGPESCRAKPVEIPQLVYTLLPSELTQDMARALITAYGDIAFSISPPEKGCFPIEAGNYTMSTNPCWQTSTTALSGDGKLFWFVWQKQITPHVTMPVTTHIRANVGGVLYCVLPPWGYWQEVSSTWEKPIYSTCTSCWLMNIVGLWKTSLSVYF